MRILQVITLCELGGAQAVVVNLANGLCGAHEVIVAAGEGDGKMFDSLDSSVKIERIESLVRKLSPLREIKAIAALRKLYLKYRPDIIHLHSSKAGILGRIVFPGSKIVYTVHGFDSIRVAYRQFLPLEKLLQYRCASIVSVSGYDEQNLRSEGISHNVVRIANGVSWHFPLDHDPFTHIVGFSRKVLCIARLAPPKNHRLFIEVATLLPEYAFIWIGNQQTPEFPFPRNVFFEGNIPQASAFIPYADLFMLPSDYEGLPLSVIEALACGVPVVASAVGGVPELLDGSNGMAVENEASVMARAVRNIMKMSSDEKKKMSEAAVMTYRTRYTVDHMVDGYLRLYNRISSEL